MIRYLTIEEVLEIHRLLLSQSGGTPGIRDSGGLHVRGACLEPAWHSLRNAWEGETAYCRLYPEVQAGDEPFAEDCVGDQFLLRDGQVFKLSAETGEVDSLEVDLGEFFEAVAGDPVESLSLHPLLQFQEDGGTLQPGQLLSVYPPFCSAESADGVSLSAVPTDERRRFLASLAEQFRGVPDGSETNFRVTD